MKVLREPDSPDMSEPIVVFVEEVETCEGEGMYMGCNRTKGVGLPNMINGLYHDVHILARYTNNKNKKLPMTGVSNVGLRPYRRLNDA